MSRSTSQNCAHEKNSLCSVEYALLCERACTWGAEQVAALALKLIDIRILKQDLEIIMGVFLA
jgi:hypothetical protein